MNINDKLFNFFVLKPPCKNFPPVCFQVETWPAPPYLATRLMSPPQDKAATPPPHSLEWFLVGDTTPFL